MRAIRIFPILTILTATMLVASVFVFSAVGSVDAKLPAEELKAVTLFLKQVDIVHTTDLAVKGEVITVLDFGESPTKIELLDLQSGILSELGITDLPFDIVTQIRLVTTDATITFDGRTFSLFIPSGVVKLNGVFIVDEDTDAVFEFDAEKSVISNKGQGCCKLKPVIKFASID